MGNYLTESEIKEKRLFFNKKLMIAVIKNEPTEEIIFEKKTFEEKIIKQKEEQDKKTKKQDKKDRDREKKKESDKLSKSIIFWNKEEIIIEDDDIKKNNQKNYSDFRKLIDYFGYLDYMGDKDIFGNDNLDHAGIMYADKNRMSVKFSNVDPFYYKIEYVITDRLEDFIHSIKVIYYEASGYENRYGRYTKGKEYPGKKKIIQKTFYFLGLYFKTIKEF